VSRKNVVTAQAATQLIAAQLRDIKAKVAYRLKCGYTPTPEELQGITDAEKDLAENASTTS
jgi:hypothetical protein